MTKYVGTAKASRARRLPGQSSTDKRVALAMFALTGAHPEAAEPSAGTTVLEAAPEPQCAEVQFTFAVDGTPLGAPVVVALLDEKAPASARAFRARVCGGVEAPALYEGVPVARVAAALRVDVGVAPPAAAAAKVALEEPSLRHDRAGLVSVSLQRQRVTFTLAACPDLDGRQQVVGHVVSGLATLEELCALEADADGKPARRALVCSCGAFTSAAPALAVAAEVRAQEQAKLLAQKAETPAETRARLQRESSAARGAVEDAVHEALERSKRRKLAAPLAGAGGRAGMLDALLGGGGSSEDDSEEEG